jgi:hypothetical protein
MEQCPLTQCDKGLDLDGFEVDVDHGFLLTLNNVKDHLAFLLAIIKTGEYRLFLPIP